MNLNMIRPKTQTEDLLLSISKNSETVIEQTHREAEETLENEMMKSRETFHLKPTIQIKEDWMIGLTSLEMYSSIFNKTEHNNKFEFYADTFDEFSFEELKDELEKIINNSNITPDHLQDEEIAPRIIEAYHKLHSEEVSTDGYIVLLMGYARSPFRDFGSYRSFLVNLDKDDIQLIFNQ